MNISAELTRNKVSKYRSNLFKDVHGSLCKNFFNTYATSNAFNILHVKINLTELYFHEKYNYFN